MNKVERSEILGLGEYEQIRERFRARIVQMKKQRRVALGENMTLIFENHDTVLYQIQEMLRTERISQGAAVQHEIDTYNDLVPADGQLSGTLMIEFTDPAERAAMLDKMGDLRTSVHLDMGDCSVQAVFHDQPGEEDRLPAVNYLTFDVGDAATALGDDSVEVALRIDHPEYRSNDPLSAGTRRQLAEDLTGG